MIIYLSLPPLRSFANRASWPDRDLALPCFLFIEDATRHDSEHHDSVEVVTSFTALVMKETLCCSVWAYALKSKSVMDHPWIADQIVDDMGNC